MKRPPLLILFILVLGTISSYGQGIVFRVPDNVFPMDWKKSGFKGLLMLEQDSPSGLFISSPDDGETIDQLRERAAQFIAPMILDEKERMEGDEKLSFEIKEISKNDGDSMVGQYYLYKGKGTSVQILFYLREANGSTFLYGYFGRKRNDEKTNSRWADEDGKGVKLLKNFVETFRD